MRIRDKLIGVTLLSSDTKADRSRQDKADIALALHDTTYIFFFGILISSVVSARIYWQDIQHF